MLDLLAFQRRLFQRCNQRNFLLAFSGGMDSTVLLDLLCRLRPDVKLRAMHVNHGIHPDAALWEQHCVEVTKSRDVPCLVERLDAMALKQGGNLEARARDLRYARLQAALRPGEVLLTAHHLDDQAETFLLQLFRGAGVKGLSAMPWMKDRHGMLHARPLLDEPRSVLLAYALAEDLGWCDDPSNAHMAHRRNYIRHKLMPMLRDQWPGLDGVLARTAAHCAHMQATLDGLVVSDYQRCLLSGGRRLAVATLSQLSLARRQEVLRHWFFDLNLQPPSQRRLQSMARDMVDAAPDRRPKVAWGEHVIQRYQGALSVIERNRPAIPTAWSSTWDGKKPLCLPAGMGKLCLASCLKTADFDDLGVSYVVRFRQGGERLLPEGSSHPVRLKRWLHAQGIPPWERDRMPLVFQDGVLVALCMRGFKSLPSA